MTAQEGDSQPGRRPLGPKLEHLLGKSELDLGTSESAASFTSPQILDEVRNAISKQQPLDPSLWDDVLEELILMNLPAYALALKGDYLDAGPPSFRGLLALGSAGMMAGQTEMAEDLLVEANRLVPEEPAPYTNISLINMLDGDFAAAKPWIEEGLRTNPGHMRLWSLAASWLASPEAGSDDEKRSWIAKLATSTRSWQGALLARRHAGDLSPEGALAELEPFFYEGLVEPDFLIEFTAQLGLSGQYERIPQVLWQVEGTQGGPSGVPWQVYVHAVQAHLAAGQEAEGRALWQRLEGARKMFGDNHWSQMATAITEVLEGQDEQASH